MKFEYCILGIIVMFCSLEAVPVIEHPHHRSKRNNGLKQTSADRDSCKPGATEPVTRVNTTERLKALRDLFDANGIDAYIIPTADAHQSEYPSDYDLRRQFISGFTGSAGTAIVLRTQAALWTDGRYYLAAEDELDCNWILMKSAEPTTPSMEKWLIDNLGATNGTVGASPYFVSSSSWLSMESTLKDGSVNLKQITNDLIDQIWTTGRPAEPNSTINELPMSYAGRSWENKIEDMHAAMAEKNVDALIITGLDETAWLFNLRGADIAYNPFFISYAIVERRNNRTRLFLKEKDRKLIEDPSDEASPQKLYKHLNTGNTGTCAGKTGLCVEVVDYDTMLPEIQSLNTDTGITQVWVAFQCNYAIYAALNQKKIHQANTPAALIKCRKNSIEQQGMRNSHIRDAVALIKFVSKLEKEVKEGKKWTEVSAAANLKEHRLLQEKNRGLSFTSISAVGSNGAIIHYHPSESTNKELTLNEMYLLDSGGQYLQQEINRGLSFPSISGSGPNGAIIHYFPTPATDRDITVNDMYLLDSGGQYLDGTTDVTRTFHFGGPTAYQKDCYTRVLMGHVDLARMIFPTLYGKSQGWLGAELHDVVQRECYTRVLMGHVDLARFKFFKGPHGPYGREIDAVARRPLWEVGLDYRHGTGHGIGAYLSVHEGPGRISLSHAPFDSDEVLDKFQFFSDEPGYYEAGQFGIRLENIVMVTEAETKNKFMNSTFLTFETVTLVPYEKNLIDYELLSIEQMDWINKYHKKVQDIIGPLISNDPVASAWLQSRTGAVSLNRYSINKGDNLHVHFMSVILCVIFAL